MHSSYCIVVYSQRGAWAACRQTTNITLHYVQVLVGSWNEHVNCQFQEWTTYCLHHQHTNDTVTQNLFFKLKRFSLKFMNIEDQKHTRRRSITKLLVKLIIIIFSILQPIQSSVVARNVSQHSSFQSNLRAHKQEKILDEGQGAQQTA